MNTLQAALNSRRRQFEMRDLLNRLRESEVRWIANRGILIWNEKKQPIRMTGTVVDITEGKRETEKREQAEKAAEAANQAKSAFLASMSHELRTPMNAILGMTDLALGMELPPKARDYLKTSKDSADMLLALLNEILDFSRSALFSVLAQALGLQNVSAGANPSATMPAPSPAPARCLRILLAEDTPANQKLVLHILGNRGHTIETACNGRQAVNLLTSQDFDVVLMDVQMPEMDGFQATAAIRQLEDAEKARLPIIALTGVLLPRDGRFPG